MPDSSSDTYSNFASALLRPAAPLPSTLRGRSDKRFGVYRNNVTVGLVRAMEANFPTVRKLLGEIYFAGLARAFVQAHPPQSPLLYFYGDAFAAFLEAQNDLNDFPYLADMARLEQLWRHAYHAADLPCLRPEDIAAVNPDDLACMQVVPHPALGLLASRFAVQSIHQAHQATAVTAPHNIAHAEYVLITRPAFDVELRLVSAGTFEFMRKLAQAEPFGVAAEAAFALDPNLDLADCMSTMLLAGAFQICKTEGS